VYSRALEERDRAAADIMGQVLSPTMRDPERLEAGQFRSRRCGDPIWEWL